MNTRIRNNPEVRAGVILQLAVLCAPGVIGAAPPAPKHVDAAPRGPNPLKIDGQLNEPAWAKAAIATGFVERTPYPGQTAAVRTEFRVLYDEDTVYVGLKMFTGGTPPRAWTRARDSFSVFSDDAISLKFDVRLDRRTTVGFVTNPAGVELDYLAVENGGDFRREYDAIWRVATSVADDHWVAEFALPVIALGLPSGQDVNRVGLQVSRDHNARLATYDWSEMPPEFGPTSALYYGRVEKLDGLTGGSPVTLLPYALGALAYRPPEAIQTDDLELKVGGDIRARWGRDIWTELTILTDFAQVDLDDPVVNTNRFPLFFPERRPFFLSGLEVFDYGEQGFSQIFFSRRIGLDEGGNTVPLLAGLKSYGSINDFRFGVLQVVTDRQGDAPARSYSIVRARQNFGERGHVGVLATLEGRVPALSRGDDPFEPNISVGGDGALRAFDRRLEVTGFFAGTINAEDEDQQGFSGQGRIAWKGENLLPTITTSFVSEEFDPAIGFVARTNLLRNRIDLDTVFRPEGSGVQRFNVFIRGQVEQQLTDGAVLGQRGEVGTEVALTNGLFFGGRISQIEDVVREDFTLFDEVPIAADRYFGRRVLGYFGLTSQRNPFFDVAYSYDTSLFGGSIHTVDGSAGLNLAGFARSEVGFTASWAQFDGFDTIQATTLNGKVSITPSVKLVFDLIGQLNTVEERTTALVRVRWRYLPGSDLFFVYRETIPYGDSEVEPGRSLTLKLNYRFDTLL